MENKLKTLSLLLIFNLSLVTSIFSYDIKIQRILNTGKVNLCITQDKDGLFLIGTEGGGLLCYDGNEIKKTKIKEGEKSFEMVPSVFVDSEGIIWAFVQRHGLFSCDKNIGIWNRYKSETGNSSSLTSDNSYWSASLITEDKEGLIWIGTNDGLNSYNKKTNKFTQYRHNPDNPNSLSNNCVWAVFVDKEGLIWIGTNDGLNSYNKATNSFSCYKHDPNNINSLSDSSVFTVKEDKNGNLWIGTKNGMCSFNKQTKVFTTYKHDPNNPNSLSYDEVRYIMIDRSDNLWICSEGGTGIDKYYIKTNTFKNYRHNTNDPNSISSNEVLHSFEDNSGTIWLIDSSGGLNKCTLKMDIFKNYSYNSEDPFSLISDNLAKLYEDKRKNIWIGAFKSGLGLYTSNDKFEKFSHVSNNPFSLPSNTVYSILDAPNNNLWVGSFGGFISLFDTETKRVTKIFKDPYSDTPCHLVMDNEKPELLWFSSYFTSGLFRLNTKTGKVSQYKYNSTDTSSVSNENTTDILQDGDILWLGTGGAGLTKFNKTTGKCIHYKHDPNQKNSISGNVVVQSYIDNKSNFWVATDDGGLNKFDRQTEKFVSYGMESGFPSNSVRHILEDNDGNLWISTDSGIVKFDPQVLKVVKRFTVADGLPSNQFDKLANPLKDSNGNFWFSTLKGLTKFKPEEASKIMSNQHIPPIILSSFKSKEETYNEDGMKKLTKVKLEYPDTSFRFTFAVSDYMAPEKNQYAYKLEGFDKDWNYIGTNNFGQYSNLNPREYTLHLKGSNNDGIWNEEGISIKITITPPFWMTSWFKWLVGIFILSIIGGAVYLIINTMKKKGTYEKEAQSSHDIRSTAITYNKKENVPVAVNQKDMKAELVSSLLEYLTSEKRVQMTEKSIDLILEFGNNTHNCFVNLEPKKFKRTISNLINNASKTMGAKGIIRVVLANQSGSNLVIKIIDNGKGISEDILSKIKQTGTGFGKKEGYELVISSAVQNIKSWGGSYDIQSNANQGTIFTITLPIAKEPDWFQGEITIPLNTHIVVLDDNESIHNIWRSHFSEYPKNKSVTLDHFYTPSEFIEYCKTLRSENDLFLVAHKFANFKGFGLELIEQLDLKNQAILVTSQYEDNEIRERVRNLGIRIIPKNFVPYVTIKLGNNNG